MSNSAIPSPGERAAEMVARAKSLVQAPLFLSSEPDRSAFHEIVGLIPQVVVRDENLATKLVYRGYQVAQSAPPAERPVQQATVFKSTLSAINALIGRGKPESVEKMFRLAAGLAETPEDCDKLIKGISKVTNNDNFKASEKRKLRVVATLLMGRPEQREMLRKPFTSYSRFYEAQDEGTSPVPPPPVLPAGECKM